MTDFVPLRDEENTRKKRIVARLHLRLPTFSRMTHKEWEEMTKNVVKEWHFEKLENGRGVKPVPGKADRTKGHLEVSDVIIVKEG